MLKEIKTRYENPCHKCKRVVKVGWTAFFEPNGKHLYCKPCGEIMLNKEENDTTPNPEAPNFDFQQLADDVREGMESIGTMVRTMGFQVAEILATQKLSDKKPPKKT